MIGSFDKLMGGVALTLICTLLTLEAQQGQGTTEPPAQSTFDPPRILAILRPNEAPATAGTDVNDYFINRGQEVNIKRGISSTCIESEGCIHPYRAACAYS